MWQMKLVVDFNGIVAFDPEVVTKHLGKIRRGTNLFRRFTTTSKGDEVLAAGLFVPVLAIDDSSYDILVRFDYEESLIPDEWVLCENGVYPLVILDALVIADLEALLNWNGCGRHPDQAARRTTSGLGSAMAIASTKRLLRW